jgi:hypothetical protein
MKGPWIKKPQQDTTVIFVHGILSSTEECWKNENGTYWPELLSQNEELKGLGIYTFSYSTGIFSGSYNLNDVVDDLKVHLNLDGVLNQGKRLIFVCHSMGGIVVRKFIVQRQTDLINLNVQIGLFLVASPSLGAGYANLITGFAKILNIRNAQAEALCFSQNNVWLNGLDTDFINLKENKYLDITGQELIEDKPLILKHFLNKQIVEPFSGAKYFGEHFKVTNSDHSSIAKPDSSDAIQHRLLCQFIKNMLVSNGNADKPENHNQHTPPNNVTQTNANTQSSNVNSSTLRLLQEKLEYLLAEEVKNADPARGFQLKKALEEARQKIEELGG